MANLTEIPLYKLTYILVPLLFVIYLHFRWKTQYLSKLYATGRMLLQLVLLGYFLTFVFELNNAWVILGVLMIMTVAASVISMRNIKKKSIKHYLLAYGIIVFSGGIVLFISTHLILGLDPWYYPRYFIPLAGMTFANTMNSLSIASERYDSEYEVAQNYVQSRNKAYKAGLIPVTNSFLAVGLVSIPGMMTGQILSGVSPLIAARYQVMIMGMVFSSSGIATALYLKALSTRFFMIRKV